MSTSDAAHRVATSAAAARALLQSMAELIVDDDTADIIIDTETDLPGALDRAMHRIMEMESHSEALTLLTDRIDARRIRFDKNIETLRRSIQAALETVEIRKMELPIATLSLRAVPPAVVIVDQSLIPAEFMRHPPAVPDKAMIKASLKAGMPIDGVMLSNGGTTLAVAKK